MRIIDTLRGVAILLVFGVHVVAFSFGAPRWGWDGLWFNFADAPSRFFYLVWPTSWGFAGVAVFFVVSGFCIHLSAIRSRSWSFGSYIIRRFFRIYPPYLLSLLFFSVAFVRLDLTTWYGIAQLGTHALLVHNFHPQSITAINSAYWSIAFEWQLYLLYPLLLMAKSRWGFRNVIVVLAIACIAMRSVMQYSRIAYEGPLPTSLFLITHQPFFFWFEWSVGAYLADRWVNKEGVSFLGRTPWIAWAMLAVFAEHFRLLSAFSFPLASVATAAFLDRALHASHESKSGIASRFFQHVGLSSYSLYLWHMPLLMWLIIGLKFRWGVANIPLLWCVGWLAFFPIWGWSHLLFVTVEKHSQDWGRDIARRLFRKAPKQATADSLAQGATR